MFNTLSLTVQLLKHYFVLLLLLPNFQAPCRSVQTPKELGRAVRIHALLGPVPSSPLCLM